MNRFTRWNSFQLGALALGTLTAAFAPVARADVYVADTFAPAVYQYSDAGVQSTVSTTLGHPVGLALDAAGDLYADDSSTGNVYEFMPGGAQSTFTGGFTNLLGLAFDASGNLFVAAVDATSGAGSVVKVTPAGVQSTFATGLGRVRGVALDGAGNVYVADLDAGSIFKYTPDGTQSTFASGINSPTGIAFDAAGNLFYCSQGVGVFEATPAGVVTMFTANVTDPRWLAFDAVGNLYVTDVGDASGTPGQGNVYAFTPAGVRSTFANGLSYPTGIAVTAPITATEMAVSVAVDKAVIKRSSGASATVTFSRTGDASGVLKVKFALGGNLVSGKDYVALPGSIKLKPGKRSASLAITPLADGGTGKVKLTVKPGAGYAVGTGAAVQVKIK